MGEAMSEYDHIAAAVILVLIIGWLGWHALDNRIHGSGSADHG